jgi:hypothetical protein
MRLFAEHFRHVSAFSIVIIPGPDLYASDNKHLLAFTIVFFAEFRGFSECHYRDKIGLPLFPLPYKPPINRQREIGYRQIVLAVTDFRIPGKPTH